MSYVFDFVCLHDEKLRVYCSADFTRSAHVGVSVVQSAFSVVKV